MLQGAFWMFMCFAAAVGAAHLLQTLVQSAPRANLHVWLYTRNNQQQIEWRLRSFLFYHWLRGTPIRLTVVDEGSGDDTVRIIQNMTWNKNIDIRTNAGGDMPLIISGMTGNEQIVVLRMYREADLKNWPALP